VLEVDEQDPELLPDVRRLPGLVHDLVVVDEGDDRALLDPHPVVGRDEGHHLELDPRQGEVRLGGWVRRDAEPPLDRVAHLLPAAPRIRGGEPRTRDISDAHALQ
jgi:hypothetical protein